MLKMPPALKETEDDWEILFVWGSGLSVSMGGSAVSLSGSPPCPSVGQAAAVSLSAMAGSNACGLQSCDYLAGAGCPSDLNHSRT